MAIGTAVPVGAVVPLEIGRGERLLVIAPHPDDETLGAGGLIQRLVEQGGSVRVLLVTAGDGFVSAVRRATGNSQPGPRAFIDYGKRRLDETRAALRALAGARAQLDILGFPDGALEPLLSVHWLRGHPLQSPTTRASDPPYDDAIEHDVRYDGIDLRRQIERVFAEFRPTLIALPDPADRHRDHRASGIFALAAVGEWMRRNGAQEKPRLLAYLVHWPAWPPGWDGRSAGRGLDLPADLLASTREPLGLTLTGSEAAGKRRALARHATQLREMKTFLMAFVRGQEPFRRLTIDDVRRAAHEVGVRSARQLGSPGSG